MFAFLATKWAARKVIVGTLLRSWLLWAGIAVFAAFTALWLHDRHLYDQIHNVEDGYIAQIAKSSLQVSHCEANNVGLHRQIEAQNAAAAALKAKGDELQQTTVEQAEKIAELERERGIWESSWNDEVVGKSCDEAMAYLLKKAIEGGQ
jgi:cell division protein FtsB